MPASTHGAVQQQPHKQQLFENNNVQKHEKTARQTSQAVERRPGQIRERHDLADNSAKQVGADMLMPSPHYCTLRLYKDDDDNIIYNI